MSSDEGSGLDCLDTAIMLNDDDDDMDLNFSPDTPSPVFSRKLRTRLPKPSVPKPSAPAKWPSPIAHILPTRSQVHVPQTRSQPPSPIPSTSRLTADQNKLNRAIATNRLKLKRSKKKPQQIVESESEDEMCLEAETMFRNRVNLLDMSSDSDDELLPMLNDLELHTERAETEQMDSSSESSDIEAFLDEIIAPIPKNRLRTGNGVKRKSDMGLSLPEKRTKMTLQSCTASRVPIDNAMDSDSLIILDDFDDSTSPLDALDDLVNGESGNTSIAGARTNIILGISSHSPHQPRSWNARKQTVTTFSVPSSNNSRMVRTRTATRTSTRTSVSGLDNSLPDANFVQPGAYMRSGRTPTENRTRRRGIRTPQSANLSVSSLNGLVSPATRAHQQFAQDEALARKLQEEMDHEFAENLARTLSVSPPMAPPMQSPHRSGPRHRPSAVLARGGRGARPRTTPPTGIDYNTHMLAIIGELSDYEWELHRATATGQRLPQPPPQYTRTVEEIINQEVIDYIHEQRNPQQANRENSFEEAVLYDEPVLVGSGITRARSMNERSPIRLGSRRHRVATRSASTARVTRRPSAAQRRRAEADLDYETSILMRIGGLTDNEWASYEAVYYGTGQRENQRSGGIDSEILDYLHLDQTRRRRQSGRVGTRGRLGRGQYLQESFSNDYEALLNLAESIGEVKQRGLTDHQVNLLPTKLYRASEIRENGSRECNICMGEYEENDSLRLLQCFHYYHSTCIDRWLKENGSCPICRENVKFD